MVMDGKLSMEHEISVLTEEFAECRNVLIALGDENRQHLILEMMQMGQCHGVRVGDITERTHLSRPAVSHHLQILKNAGILKVRHDGTKNYYYFDPEGGAFRDLMRMLEHAGKILSAQPDRGDDSM